MILRLIPMTLFFCTILVFGGCGSNSESKSSSQSIVEIIELRDNSKLLEMPVLPNSEESPENKLNL